MYSNDSCKYIFSLRPLTVEFLYPPVYLFLYEYLINISNLIFHKLNFNLPYLPKKKKTATATTSFHLPISANGTIFPKLHPSPSTGHFASSLCLKTHPCLNHYLSSSVDYYSSLLLFPP